MPRSTAEASRAAPVLICTGLFIAALVAGLGGIGERLVAPLRDFTVRLAEAHYEMQRAVAYVNPEGLAEYAVLPAGDSAASDIRRFVAAREGWRVRPSAIAGWLVVEAPREAEDTLITLREQPFSRVALRNRGLWICH